MYTKCTGTFWTMIDHESEGKYGKLVMIFFAWCFKRSCRICYPSLTDTCRKESPKHGRRSRRQQICHLRTNSVFECSSKLPKFVKFQGLKTNHSKDLQNQIESTQVISRTLPVRWRPWHFARLNRLSAAAVSSLIRPAKRPLQMQNPQGNLEQPGIAKQITML